MRQLHFFPAMFCGKARVIFSIISLFFPLADRAYDSSAQRRDEEEEKKYLSIIQDPKRRGELSQQTQRGFRKKRRILSSFGWAGEPRE